MAQGESARLSPRAMQKSPVSRYQAPAARIGRGRKRHDENIPKLKMTCQMPGSIHNADGTERNSTIVTSRLATTDGRNCSTAIAIISSDMPECMRRLRVNIWAPAKAADTKAVEIQMAR